ncbi:MAG: TraI domain-containing protein [Tatlockia sp.]
MFHRYGKKEKASQTKATKGLIPIVSAPLILAEEKRAALLKEIKASCDLTATDFDALGLSLIHNLINHCQNLPETSTSFYAQPGGVLDYALNRTEAALSLFKQYLVQEGQSPLSKEQTLWQYALFSAAVLKGVGKLQCDYAVSLFDNEGKFLKQWNPLLEIPGSLAHYYQYTLEKAENDAHRHRLNLLLARFLMPEKGFAWIASNSEVLSVWLALLNEDVESVRTFGALLIRADAIAISRSFQLLFRPLEEGRGRYGRAGTFSGGKSYTIAEIDQQNGIAFAQWLINAYETGKIEINKAPLLMVPGGLVMSDAMFQLFVRERPEYKNWQAIQKGFLTLGIHRLGPDGLLISRHFLQQKTQTPSSEMLYLGKDGKWRTPENPVAEFKSSLSGMNKGA